MCKQIKGIIFDMDGVLVDTEYWYQKRRQNFLQTLGCDLHLDWQAFIGETFTSLWDEIKDEIPMSLAKVEEQYKVYKEQHPITYENMLIPGVKPIIKLLFEKGYKLAVASSSTLNDIKRCLEINDLTGYFTVINSARDLGEPKPSSLVYNKTIEDLKLAVDELITVEDSAAGIKAAKGANLKVVAYYNSKYNLDQSNADFQIVQHAQLITILERLNKN